MARHQRDPEELWPAYRRAGKPGLLSKALSYDLCPGISGAVLVWRVFTLRRKRGRLRGRPSL